MKVSSPFAKSILIVPVLCIIFFLFGLNDTIRNSAVADEIGGHMASGYLYWKTGSYSGGVMNFPLGHLIMALPVKILGCHHRLFTEDYLLLFRLPILLMGTILGFCLFRFTDSMFGRGAALVALGAYCLSPNMIAHSSLATLDVPIAAFGFFTIAAAWYFKKRPTWWRMALLSILLGCALTTKVQGVLLIPFCLLVLSLPRSWLMAHARSAPDAEYGRPAPWWAAGLLIVIPWTMIHAVYLHNPFADGALLPELYVGALEAKLFHAAGESTTGRDQIAYLMGEYSAGGWWYWFPFAILVKTPSPLLLLLPVGLCRAACRRGLVFVLVPIVLFLGAAMTASLNIGLRHVLIIYPFLFVLAGAGAVVLWQKGWGRLLAGVLGLFFVWQTVTIAPHHLAFFNAPAGGPRKGDEFLIGSNYDWGQSDHFLRDYVNRRNVAYAINPDPGYPRTGRILVNSTALHGAYGSGGKEAYAWLKRFEPINRIAHCWYEYDIPADAFTEDQKATPPAEPLGRICAWRPWEWTVPPDQRNAILHDLDRHLQRNARHCGELEGPRYLLSLASAYLVAGSYDCLLDLLRQLLEYHPQFDQSIALGLGSEVAVRWKVGILNFEEDEYLTGFGIPDSVDGEPAPDAADLGRSARRLGIQSDLANYHLTAAFFLEKAGRRESAIEQYEWVLHFEPDQGPIAARAAQRLKALRK